MIRDVMGDANLVVWPEFALILFVSVFCGVCIMLWRGRKSDHYKEIANSILEEEKLLNNQAGRGEA